MCGTFSCSKKSLMALNCIYIVVGILLISVAAAAKYSSVVSSVSLVGGIIACGVFLLLTAAVGVVAASRHHQVALFAYMTVLFLIFVVQFSVACACLAMDRAQQEALAKQGWASAPADVLMEAQHQFGCCGYDGLGNGSMPHPSCYDVHTLAGAPCCPGASAAACCPSLASCQCQPCQEPIRQAIDSSVTAAGSVGLVFSLTEFVGVWLTVRYRNQRDPAGHASAFL